MEEKKEMKKVEKLPQIKLEDATEEQLKAAAFDVEQQIKNLQRNYQILINELQLRMEKEDGNN